MLALYLKFREVVLDAIPKDYKILKFFYPNQRDPIQIQNAFKDFSRHVGGEWEAASILYNDNDERAQKGLAEWSLSELLAARLSECGLEGNALDALNIYNVHQRQRTIKIIRYQQEHSVTKPS